MLPRLLRIHVIPPHALHVVSATQLANAFALYPGKASGALPFAMLVAYIALFISSSGIL